MRKFLVDGKEFIEVQEVINYIVDNGDFDYSYDEMLDECYEDISICGYSYSPSTALYRVDEIAYNCGKNDYIDSLTSDIEHTIDSMSDGDIEELYNVEVECIEKWFECPICGEEWETEEGMKECWEECKKNEEEEV